MRLDGDLDGARRIVTEEQQGDGYTRILLDTGHGLGNRTAHVFDPGASDNGTTEAAEVRALAAQLTGVTRIDADGKNLYGRMETINAQAQEGDVLVSLHLNAAGNPNASGVEVLYDDDRPEHAEGAARLASCLAAKLGMPNRGALDDSHSHEGDVYILSHYPARAYLLELGYIGNAANLTAVRQHGAEAVQSCLTVI